MGHSASVLSSPDSVFSPTETKFSPLHSGPTSQLLTLSRPFFNPAIEVGLSSEPCTPVGLPERSTKMFTSLQSIPQGQQEEERDNSTKNVAIVSPFDNHVNNRQRGNDSDVHNPSLPLRVSKVHSCDSSGPPTARSLTSSNNNTGIRVCQENVVTSDAHNKRTNRLHKGCTTGSSLPIEVAMTTTSQKTPISSASNPILCKTPPPGARPLCSKRPRIFYVKGGDSHSTKSNSKSPVQLTPIPSSNLHKATHFIFPEVTLSDTTNSIIELSDTLSNVSISGNCEKKTINTTDFEQSKASARLSIVPFPKPRKFSSISVEMDPILEEEDGELSSASSPVVPDKRMSNSASKVGLSLHSDSGAQTHSVVVLTTTDFDAQDNTKRSGHQEKREKIQPRTM